MGKSWNGKYKCEMQLCLPFCVYWVMYQLKNHCPNCARLGETCTVLNSNSWINQANHCQNWWILKFNWWSMHKTSTIKIFKILLRIYHLKNQVSRHSNNHIKPHSNGVAVLISVEPSIKFKDFPLIKGENIDGYIILQKIWVGTGVSGW